MKSPVPIKKDESELDFYEALRQIMMGKSVTKLEWNNRSVYGILKDGRLTLHRDDKDHDWLLTDGDIYGDDWVIL